MGWTALVDENDNEIGVVGDQPWDIMAEAMTDIRLLYQEVWGRPPTKEEIDSIVAWCIIHAFEK